MKKIYLLLFILLPLFSLAVDYPGNGKTGFGGAVGTGSLTLTDDGTTISGTFTRGTAGMGLFNDVFVLYIDNLSGANGFTSTAGFSDNEDELRKAISGFDGTNRSTLTFAPGFKPQYAIAFGVSANFGGLWQLANGGFHSLNFINPVNFSPAVNNATNYTFSFSKVDVGLTSAINFNFIATYISNTAFRSDEAIGFTPPGTGNVGQNPTTASSFYNYPSGVLPVSLTSFTATLSGSSVLFNWATASESSLSNFIVEESKDGINWQTAVSTLPKNLSQGSAYQKTSVYKNGPVNYYRLKIVSVDGSVKYSELAFIRNKNVSDVLLLGNPVRSEIKIQVINKANTKVQVALSDMNGRTLLSNTYSPATNAVNFILPVSNIASGTYILRISDGNETIQSFKVIKE